MLETCLQTSILIHSVQTKNVKEWIGLLSSTPVCAVSLMLISFIIWLMKALFVASDLVTTEGMLQLAATARHKSSKSPPAARLRSCKMSLWRKTEIYTFEAFALVQMGNTLQQAQRINRSGSVLT